MKKIAVCAQTLSNCACFWPKSEMYEGFFLFLLFVLTAFFSIPFSAFYNFRTCESSVLYISQNLFIKRPSVSLATS